jgi:hypothetical protein
MNTYKITNITNLVGKRDPKHNSVVSMDYVDNRTKKTLSLKPGEEVFISVQSLPLSVHRLRIKKLIEIAEVSPALLKASKPSKPAPKKKTTTKSVAKKEVKKEPVAEKKTTTRAPRKKTTE